ncbi:hypothetical protein Metli_0163 [Methanofollis liminatans DSM 4140]|uniref:Uncharacterized protein n=1 Tax=Methanofollis liminatans DSM 4140 TaxID=28892 RepID=J0RX85_9EURY|nr:hypothetical protein [Methanofollis liminatans]EJG06141.1 hypothetical protein Metli_0163 [Methanofollis liminatans DSM 4140]
MIGAALAALFREGDVVEVRALADRFTHSGYFDDLSRLAAAAAALDADPEVRGIYVTLNEVKPALLARRANRVKMRLTRSDPTTADADIVRRRWLPIDLDPVRPSGVSSTEEEHAAALRKADEIALWLSERGFPAPIRADSGNGAHLLYRVDLENDDGGLVRGVLATLDALFSDEHVTVDTANFNPARIWKLYGTCSRKGDHTPERPHRRARLLSVPGEVETVPVDLLGQIAALLPKDAPAPPSKGIDLAAWLSEHGIPVRSRKPWQGGTLFVLDDCPFSTAHRDGAFAIQFPSGAVYAGCHHASCGGGVQRWPEMRARHEKKKEEVPPPPPPPPSPDPAARERAMEILARGDPLAFLLDTFNREHVGDRTVAECLAISVASQSVENTNGLHVAISGNSGKGKSHACTAMLALLPETARLTGTVSNKALYYHDSLQPGTVLLFDDVSLSDDLQEVLKSATANFREPIEHRTVTADRKLQVCRIPERCVWWLAKVEDPGDDQVMNRMLTVWIDDSREQDERVLAHMKEAEAVGPSLGEDEDVLTARALWEAVREEVLPVRIPFARAIHFSAAQNRRNPGMLFDLIKCRARLFFLQRERDGEGRVLASPEDFAAAARLYGSLNGTAGGQETKLTKNEAAALETVAAMGWAEFTVKMLQEALGLSYHQTRRILHGYMSRGETYSGLLEKCPAVSYVDATVLDEGEGYAVRRRQHIFSFDPERYRRWARGAAVWIDGGGDRDDGPGGGDPCSIAAGFQQHCNTDREDRKAGKRLRSDSNSTDRETRLSLSTKVQQITNTHTPVGSGAGVGGCGCDPRNAANDPGISDARAENLDQAPISPPVGDGACCNVLKRAGKIGPVLQESLPGVLDHREFARVSTALGRCTGCGEGRAVFRSADGRVRLCEGCYGRLVRAWNAGEGVG